MCSNTMRLSSVCGLHGDDAKQLLPVCCVAACMLHCLMSATLPPDHSDAFVVLSSSPMSLSSLLSFPCPCRASIIFFIPYYCFFHLHEYFSLLLYLNVHFKYVIFLCYWHSGYAIFLSLSLSHFCPGVKLLQGSQSSLLKLLSQVPGSNSVMLN